MQLNKKTSDKYKLNAVGADASVRPKQKHEFVNNLTSNVPTSNIKFPTSNTAITLVALVITIIVLLILVGVTLNMVMGDSGIFGKANNAKEKTAYANAQEKIKLAVMNSYNTEGELDY